MIGLFDEYLGVKAGVICRQSGNDYTPQLHMIPTLEFPRVIHEVFTDLQSDLTVHNYIFILLEVFYEIEHC